MKLAMPDLNSKEQWAGIILGKNGDKDYHLILLPEEKWEIDWYEAYQFATELGGTMPTCREQHLLETNLPELFQHNWYWTGQSCTPYPDTPSACCYHFGLKKSQEFEKQFKFCARAVRRQYIDTEE